MRLSVGGMRNLWKDKYRNDSRSSICHFLMYLGECMVELNNQDEKSDPISEGEIVKIKEKWFKVEDCRLNRAYMALCGSRLFHQMRDLVCSYVDQHYGKKILKRRQTTDELISILDTSYYGICCKSACTISELIQYCP
jgi:hypothetical protein